MQAFFDIDTQIDFVFPAGALYTPGAEAVIPKVAALNRYASEHGIALISTMCAHGENDEEFKIWPPHCLKGSPGQRKPEATLVPGQILIEKDALDLFSNPEVDALLSKLDIGECFVYGVLTEYCVKCAVAGLLERGKKVSLVSEATAGQNEASSAQVIREFLAAGGEIISVAALTI